MHGLCSQRTHKQTAWLDLLDEADPDNVVADLHPDGSPLLDRDHLGVALAVGVQDRVLFDRCSKQTARAYRNQCRTTCERLPVSVVRVQF